MFPFSHPASVIAAITAEAIGVIIQYLKDQNKLDNSVETYLELVNDSNGSLIIEVSEVDNYDWDGDSRPNHTFQKVGTSRMVRRPLLFASINGRPSHQTGRNKIMICRMAGRPT